MTTKRTVTRDGYNYNLYIENKAYDDQMISYAQMAKRFMNRPFNSPLDIVGNYDWHEAYPYEKYLFYNLHNNEEKLIKNDNAKVIDFGCGPGRMVNRAISFFGPNSQVDGIDISEYAIDYARKNFNKSIFYVSSGVDVGDAPENNYDLVYSTIAMQHIPCKTIRENIFRGFHNILKPGGYISIQVAYHPTMQAGVWSHDTEHASYDSDFWNAKATNGHADMVINQYDMPKLQSDLEQIFKNVKLKTFNVSSLYGNLNGHYHAPYWAESWLFIQAQK